jgi:Omp85 superfamily domain
MRKLLLFLFLLSSIVEVLAQKGTALRQNKLYLAPLPVISSNPAFGFVYGAAASGGIFLGDPSTTSMSSGLITATYSTKKQLMFTFKPIIYTNNNSWMIIGDWRLFFSSQPTYGLGTGPSSDILTNTGYAYDGSPSANNSEGELMDFNLIRLHQTGLKEVIPDFYVGLGYHFDSYSTINDQLLDLEADPPVLTSHYTHSITHGFDPEGYIISGISVNTIYDTRDNVANTYTGRYAFASLKMNPEFLGSDQYSSTLWLEYRDYFSLSKKNPRNILAVWTYAKLSTGGQLPYMALPALGWDQMGRSGRAYPQGRWRGDNLYYLEAEYRVPLPLIKRNPDLLGAVLFASMTTASSKDNGIDLFEYIEPAAGIGLRIMIQKHARTNLTIDYGWGSNGESAFYLNLTEYF